MTKSEVEIGGTYRLRWHDGSFTQVRITGTRRINIRSRGYGRTVTGTKVRYIGTNLKTGRTVEIKSAAKLRERIS